MGNKEEGVDESELPCEQENGGGDAPGNGKRLRRLAWKKEMILEKRGSEGASLGLKK